MHDEGVTVPPGPVPPVGSEGHAQKVSRVMVGVVPVRLHPEHPCPSSPAHCPNLWFGPEG